LRTLIIKLRFAAHKLKWKIQAFFLLTKAATIPLAWMLATSLADEYASDDETPHEAVANELSYWREDA